MFFSISPNDYGQALLDEIYGCFKYIGIPIDTVMNMPVQNRKYFITKHNYECEEMNKKYGNEKSVNVSGESTMSYTQMSISDHKYLGPR
jgi:hypothetical protein